MSTVYTSLTPMPQRLAVNAAQLEVCFRPDMSDYELLEKAIGIAVQAHHGQKDRYGLPYILHPLRVMARVSAASEQTVAILHDVVEDTNWTLEDLRKEGFPAPLLHALDCVTKREGEPYDRFVERSASDPLARRVKLADLEDNMDLRRFPEIAEKDAGRIAKYLKAWRTLSSLKDSIGDGNASRKRGDESIAEKSRNR